ncbi:8512_t:CDS:1 [Funneliformis geosporum]|uniref:5828_t:CDS:1 n=1 Tax=Funneliformis geosporum TaxID=1117311 RepID=A0A9W4SQU0_9GLOM|nr:8512_t:CDS:1 [Funneliformis geosporum]CAI2177549.1 5828_t:CDS:1 [Funneliformis geosporum]
MDEATKKKYCHLLMFDIAEQSQEKGLNHNGSDQNDNVNPCLNNSSQETATTISPTSPTLSNKSLKQRKPRARKPKRTPRPPNAFILYRKAKQPDVIAQSNNLTNAEVSKVISKMWWNETEEERFYWEKQADRMKLKHMQDYPDYVYQPKKPGTKKRKSAQSDKSTFSVIPLSEKISSKLPDETITAIAEVVGSKSNRSISSTSDTNSLPSPPPSIDRPPTNQPILHNHHMTFHHNIPNYAVLPPTPATDLYDISAQYLLPPPDYISHAHLTMQHCFNPIYATSYADLSGNTFLDAQPVDKFSHFIGQDAYSASPSHSYPFNSFDVTSVDNYANSNTTEFFATTLSSAPTMSEDMTTYFDESHRASCPAQYFK